MRYTKIQLILKTHALNEVHLAALLKIRLHNH